MTLYQRWLEMLVKWCEVNQLEHAECQAEKLDRVPMFRGMAADLKTMRQRSNGQRIEGSTNE